MPLCECGGYAKVIPKEPLKAKCTCCDYVFEIKKEKCTTCEKCAKQETGFCNNESFGTAGVQQFIGE